MLLALLVIEQHLALHSVGGDLFGDLAWLSLCRQVCRDFEDVVGGASVAAGVVGDRFEHGMGRGNGKLAKPTRFVNQRSLKQRDYLLLRKGIQRVNTAARE